MKMYTTDPWSFFSTSQPSEGTPWIVTDDPAEEIHREVRGPHAVRVYQECIRSYRHVETGEVVERLVQFSHFESTSDHDVCLWCGTSNGANGELREGWDCYMCGSN